MRKSIMHRKLFLLFLLAIGIWVAFSLKSGGGDEASTFFELMREQLARLKEFDLEHPVLMPLAFAGAIFLASVLGLPPPGILAVAAGSVCGFAVAFMISLPSAVLGAVVPFWFSRKCIGPILRRRFSEKIAAMQAHLQSEGPFYLFSVRLVPLAPFPLVNLFMGLTSIRATTFTWVTFIGRIPLTILYCNAGTQLSKIQNSGDILTPNVVISLALLAVFPHLARIIVQKMSAYKTARLGS